MKIKDGFIIREIAGTWIVVPIRQRVVEFNGLLTLSETGVFLWHYLDKESTKEDLVSAIVEDYDIDELTANSDVEEFINQLKEKELLVI